MNRDVVRSLLTEALLELDKPDEPEPPAIIISTAAALDAALASAPTGAVLTLDPALVYATPLKVTNGIRLESQATLGQRMTKEAPAPRFTQGATLGRGVSLVGLDIRHTDPNMGIVTFAGAECVLDGCRILGDPIKGARRGVVANGDGDCAIVQCYIDDCFGPYPGNDTQAIIAWDMAPGLLIEDCYLSGGTETIMIGGADPKEASRDPRNITIRGNTITKKPAWQTQLIGVKNTIELKNARHVLIENNDISQSWGLHGQDGYAFVATVRNQDGKDPTASIQDVVFRNNRVTQAGAAINILGMDNNHQSEPMARITIDGNTFTDIDAKLHAGATKLILITAGPNDLAITNNRFVSVGHTSTIYFVSGPPLQNFTFTGNTYPKTKYGMFGSNVPGINRAFDVYVASGVTSPNTEV